MTVAELEALGRVDPEALRTKLAACCGARRWVDAILARQPWGDREGLLAAAEAAAETLERDDWLEAFAHHPRIGDVDALRRRFGVRAGGWSEGEQAGMASADDDVVERLAAGNRRYEERFGYLFIVCATGKSAAEMLAILERRLPHDPATELAVAAAEQRKITQLRLEKLLADAPPDAESV